MMAAAGRHSVERSVTAAMPAPPPLRRDLRRIALLDTNRRAATGALTYPALWLLIGFFGGLYRVYPAYFTFNAVCLALLTTARLVFARYVGRLMQAHFNWARYTTYACVLSSGMYWGLLAALTINDPALASIRTAMLVATVGVASGGVNILAIDRVLRIAFPLLIILPSIAVLLLARQPGDLLLAAMSSVYLGYIMRAPQMIQHDYWDAQEHRALLEERSRELETLSMTDTLTRVSNRLYFDTHYEIAWRRACEAQSPLAVLLIDLDHFKTINDTYGHPFGDLCLQQVAAALRGEIRRSGDVLARYGGEEFIVLLSNAGAEYALMVAERLLDAVAALAPCCGGGQDKAQDKGLDRGHDGDPAQLSCSIGVATRLPQRSEQAYRLISEADAALYEAKRGGRNRAVLAGGVATRGSAAAPDA